MKQKVLIVGITMAAAGTEKSFLSFAKHAIDYSKYDVDLLLAKKDGAFLAEIPKEIRVLEMGDMGEIFLINKDNAKNIILKRYLMKNPFRAFLILPHMMKRHFAKTKEEKDYASNRIWVELLKKMPPLPEKYDIALAYWGDHTMFYLCDKVQADRKIAWLHFDYRNPPREDALYLHYFSMCDKIVTVSEKIETSLKEALPEIADKVVTVENIVDGDEIRALAMTGQSYSDGFGGLRIVTVGRIAPQKGYDLAMPAIANLVKCGVSVRYYIMGDGDDGDKEALKQQIENLGISENVVFLGIKQNPYPYIKDADIYMQPSRHEGKPIAVEEAKVLCKPILVTAYASAAEQLENGNLGMICEISEQGIAGALQKMAESADLRLTYTAHLEENLAKSKGTDKIFEKLL